MGQIIEFLHRRLRKKLVEQRYLYEEYLYKQMSFTIFDLRYKLCLIDSFKTFSFLTHLVLTIDIVIDFFYNDP